MKFSLIVGTVERTAELSRLLDSLARQTCRDFEVIIVDQSGDDRFVPLIDAHRRSMAIVHVRSDRRGASRARNLGIERAGGDVIAFPDDDCWYPADLLDRVVSWLAANPSADVLSVRCVDQDHANSVVEWPSKGGPVNRRQIWRQCVEAGLFARRHAVEEAGHFDETLGVGGGTPWGAGEGTDYILRALDKGMKVRYEPTIYVHHPNVLPGYDEIAWARASSYGRGMGRVLRKHRYPIHRVVYYWIRPLGAAILYAITGRFGKARFYLYSFAGRVVGWLPAAAETPVGRTAKSRTGAPAIGAERSGKGS